PNGRRVHRLIAMKNTFAADEQYHRFTIDPLALADAEKDADEEGAAVVGFYHSHPDHPAKPSEYDRQHVPPWSYYSHVIIAIEKGEPKLMTAWNLDEETEQFKEQVIVPEEDAMSSEYAHPESLVSTGWVAEHLNDPKVK